MLDDFNSSSILINFILIALIFVFFFCIHSDYLKTFFHDKDLTFSNTYFIPSFFSFYILNL